MTTVNGTLMEANHILYIEEASAPLPYNHLVAEGRMLRSNGHCSSMAFVGCCIEDSLTFLTIPSDGPGNARV